jgi:hypothetical protein
MLRPSLTTAAVALLCTGAMAQADFKSSRFPITSPIRNAGVYHVATGTWTRRATNDNLTAKVAIYNNTCAAIYFTRMTSGDKFAHRSRVPSPSGETLDSQFYGTTNPAHRWDKRPGCQQKYLVTSFEVAYCSSSIANVDWEYAFTSSYTLCGAGDMNKEFTYLLTGLPGGSPTGLQRCWIVGVDISTTTPALSLFGDGDGTYDPANKALEQFGFQLSPRNTTSLADFTGPIIAGDFSWTGGPGTVSGVLAPCTGTDGTWWDNPIDLSEDGTGMNSNDFFRIGGTAPQVAAGCYFFGGHPHGDFWLKLFAKTTCPPPDPSVAYCFPNVAGVRSCPCNNQQVPALSAKGCNNFGPTPAGGTGGANLFASGTPAANTTCDVQFHVRNEHGTANITVLFIGRSTIANGVASGAGVRCVGTLQTPRPYKKNSVISGTVSNVDYGLGVGADLNAWTRSGSPVGVTKYYYAAYRNSKAAGNGPCVAANAFNLTNAIWIVWP